MTQLTTVFHGRRTSRAEYECFGELLVPIEAIVFIDLCDNEQDNYPVELKSEYESWLRDEGKGEAVYITAGELRRIHPFNIDGRPLLPVGK